MLVYASQPNQIVYFCGYTIYGSAMVQGPVDVPFEIYSFLGEAIVDATYREGVVSKILKKRVPEMAFTYSTLKYMPENFIYILGKLSLGRKYKKRWPMKKKLWFVKDAIRKWHYSP